MVFNKKEFNETVSNHIGSSSETWNHKMFRKVIEDQVNLFYETYSKKLNDTLTKSNESCNLTGNLNDLKDQIEDSIESICGLRYQDINLTHNEALAKLDMLQLYITTVIKRSNK